MGSLEELLAKVDVDTENPRGLLVGVGFLKTYCFMSAICEQPILQYTECFMDCLERTKGNMGNEVACVQEECHFAGTAMESCLKGKAQQELQPKNGVIERNIERGCGVNLFDVNDKRPIRSVRECNEAILAAFEKSIPSDMYPKTEATQYLVQLTMDPNQ